MVLFENSFLPHVDTEKVNGMFATIVIVLPTAYSGGSAHLSHGGLSKAIDYSSTSLTTTTALSWYTDVTHEIKPITSGYRLALSYNVIHTTNSIRPALKSSAGIVEELRHVLLSWRQDQFGEAPAQLIFELDYQYSEANLSGSALKGRTQTG